MKPISILLVEDSEGDILLTTEALAEGRISNKLFVVKDGWEAIQYLEKNGKYSTSITPDLVFLDVNLPKIDGHEVLKFIKSKENLKHIPVIMLTTSSSEKDIPYSYQNNVNCYITKPVDSEEFIRTISSIKDFWISVVQLPRN